MPLHLLGKKSWNVYNADNIARVRRDEATAAAAEDAEEQRMQEADTARRTAILRGETPPPIVQDADRRTVHDQTKPDGSRDLERDFRRKRRKLKGEDDTERDIRLAREDGQKERSATRRTPHRSDEQDSITDANGNISLFLDPDRKRSARTIEQDKAAAAKRKKEEDETIGMRFSHAAGYKTRSGEPWYTSKAPVDSVRDEETRTDAFGNEDPHRKDRDERRVLSRDPMAMMRQAQDQLRRAEQDRSRWDAQRRAEMQKLEEEQRRDREEKRRRRRDREKRRERDRAGSDDSLEGFSLDRTSAARHGGRRRHSGVDEPKTRSEYRGSMARETRRERYH